MQAEVVTEEYGVATLAVGRALYQRGHGGETAPATTEAGAWKAALAWE